MDDPILKWFEIQRTVEDARVYAITGDYDACEFSLIEAAFLWYDLKPNINLFHESPPKKVLSIAKVIFEQLKPIERNSSKHWRYQKYSIESLKELAMNRGEKPPFLFPEVRMDFNNWLRINNYHPDDTEELTKGGYKAIAIMARLIQQCDDCTVTDAIQKIVAEAEIMKDEDPDTNIYGVGKSSLEKLIKNGEAYLKS